MPSISNVMVPRAIADVRRAFPNLLIEVDILKIEEAIDYLLLRKGELVAVSHKLDHPMLVFEALAKGRLKCIVPQGHPLARREQVAAGEIVKYPLIGIDPNDPYGRIMAGIFSSHDLTYEVTIRARFGTTVCALVTNGLGVAIIDEFTLAGGNWPGVRAIEIREPTEFQTYVAYRKDATLSSHGIRFVAALRRHMEGWVRTRDPTDWAPRRAPRTRAKKVTLGFLIILTHQLVSQSDGHQRHLVQSIAESAERLPSCTLILLQGDRQAGRRLHR